jgi:hypothetical protein
MLTYIHLLALIILSNRSFAQQSTTLEGWVLDGNTRSSWDIFWTCLSTILACTWAALHLNVPDRKWRKAAAGIIKGLAWVGVILAPELMALYAAIDVCYARKLMVQYNNSFVATRKKEKDAEKGGPEAGPPQLSEVEVKVQKWKRPPLDPYLRLLYSHEWITAADRRRLGLHSGSDKCCGPH